jgi:hypothetical protein
MKTLSIHEIEKINGGSLVNDICIGVDIGTITYKAAFKLLAMRGIQMAAMGPIGDTVAAACVLYGVGSWLYDYFN